MERRNAFAVHLQRLQCVAAWHQLEFLTCGLESSSTATTPCHDTTNPTHNLLHEGPFVPEIVGAVGRFRGSNDPSTVGALRRLRRAGQWVEKFPRPRRAGQ